jgi:transcriptional regulator with XRE-family HTH domain
MVTSNELRAFGERLKRQRERRGTTLDSIAKTTKVAASLFAGLERGDCSRWPAGLYARAYVRAYAELIGINPDEAVEDFTAAFDSTVAPEKPGTAAHPLRHTGGLRLSMESHTINPERVLKRAGLAAADLVLGFLIAWTVHVGLQTGVWTTVACALAYHAAGRLVSDEPLLYWAFLKLRHHHAAPPEPDTAEVPVGDAASTTA